MFGRKELFYSLDESNCNEVRLGDDQEMNFARKGSVGVPIHGEKIN